MATNNLLQRMDPASLTTGSSNDTSNRRQIERFIASEAIAAGDVVAFDTSKTGPDRVLYVTKAELITNGNGLAIGAADTAAGANEELNVVIAGYAEVKPHNTVLIKNMLPAGGTSIGTVDGRVAGDISPAFGIALAGRTGPGLVRAWIYKQF